MALEHLEKGSVAMRKRICIVCLTVVCVAFLANPGLCLEEDIIQTDEGDLSITFVGHASLVLGFGGLTIHVDPFGRVADYASLPEADIVLVTHEHMDHLDKRAIEEIAGDETVLVITELCRSKGIDGVVMQNGDSLTVHGIGIVAVPAYNIVHERGNGQPFHPKGAGNGYILHFGGTRVYIAGDTENIPEMADIAGVDIAFLPMNLPYTMTPEMVAEAAKVLKPAILYPYHYGDTDTSRLVQLLLELPGTEVRIRKM
jgi:L-ascorbate metabolism protein UlaG (beta-lactamase superfamily)